MEVRLVNERIESDYDLMRGGLVECGYPRT